MSRYICLCCAMYCFNYRIYNSFQHCFTNHDYVFITVVECPVLCSIVTVYYSMNDLCTWKSMHFLCLEPRETDKIVVKFTKNLVLKFHFLLLGPLLVCTRRSVWLPMFLAVDCDRCLCSSAWSSFGSHWPQARERSVCQLRVRLLRHQTHSSQGKKHQLVRAYLLVANEASTLWMLILTHFSFDQVALICERERD